MLGAAVALAATAGPGRADPEPRPAPFLLRAVTFAPDGRRVFAGDAEGVIRIWDLPRRKLLSAVRTPAAGVRSNPLNAFSADGRRALLGRRDGDTLTLWDLATGKRLQTFATGGEPVVGIALAPDSGRALAAGVHRVVQDWDHGPIEYKAIRLWDAATGRAVRTLADGVRYGQVLAFTPDGRQAVVGAGGRYDVFEKPAGWDLQFWDLARGRETGVLPAVARDTVTSIAFSANGRHVAAGYARAVRAWERASGKLLWTYEQPYQRWQVLALAFAPDGRSLLAAGPDTDYLVRLPFGATGGLVRLGAADGRPAPVFEPVKEWIRSAAFAPDGRLLAGAAEEGLKIWDARTGRPRGTLRE